MTVQPFVDRNRSYKPRPWNVRRGLVAPEWRWAWEGMDDFIPLWSGGGDPRTYRGQTLTLQSNGVWSDTDIGTVGENDGTGGFAEIEGGSFIDTTLPYTVAMEWRSGGDVQKDTFVSIATGGNEGVNYGYRADDGGSTHPQAIAAWRTSDGVELARYEEPDDQSGVSRHRFVHVSDGADANQLYYDGRAVGQDLAGQASEGGVATDVFLLRNNNDSFPEPAPQGSTIGVVWMSQRQWSDAEAEMWSARDPFGPFRRQTIRKISVATGPQTFTRTLDDSFTQQETLNRDFSGDRILDDQQTFAEDLTDAAIRNRNLSESFTFADTLIRDVVLTRLLSDSNPLTENLNRDFFGDRLLSDDETLTENLTRTVTNATGADVTRIISDTFTLAENLIRDQILTRLPTENFSLSENFRNLINGDVIGAAAARRFISQFSNFIEDQTLDDNVVTDFVDGIFS